jgi:signal transduction histidine kinase
MGERRDELAQALLELQAVQRVAEDVISSRDLDDVLARCIDHTRQMADTSSGAIYLRDDRRGVFQRLVARETIDDQVHLPVEQIDAALSGRGYFIADMHNPVIAWHPAVQVARARGFRIVLNLGMRWRGHLIGMLLLAWRDEVTIPESTLHTLEALMGYQAAAIENARTRMALETRARLAQALLEFSGRALTTRDESALHELILDGALAIARGAGGVVSTRVGDQFRRVAGRNASCPEYLPASDPLIAAAIGGSVPLLIDSLDDAPADSHITAAAHLGNYRSLALMPLSGTPSGLLTIALRDSHQWTSEEAEALQTLAQVSSEALERCRIQLAEERLAAAKDRFLRIASHELRSPVTALRATAQLLQLDDSVHSDEARRGVLYDRIDRQSERLAKLVAQLLDSARLSADALPLDLEDVDLVALAREMADEAGPRVQLCAEGELCGRWDRARIEQVVSNLLSNALQYSPADATVELVVATDGVHAQLEVRDRGVGIPAEEQAQVFAPFYRSPHSGGRHKGMGLGLHITSEIVHRHGGTIRVISETGVGSTFVVRLPRGV